MKVNNAQVCFVNDWKTYPQGALRDLNSLRISLTRHVISLKLPYKCMVDFQHMVGLSSVSSVIHTRWERGISHSLSFSGLQYKNQDGLSVHNQLDESPILQNISCEDESIWEFLTQNKNSIQQETAEVCRFPGPPHAPSRLFLLNPHTNRGPISPCT